MVCKACQEHRHGDCRGGNWCDCQHQPPPRADSEVEPDLNWINQG